MSKLVLTELVNVMLYDQIIKQKEKINLLKRKRIIDLKKPPIQHFTRETENPKRIDTQNFTMFLLLLKSINC